MKKVMQNLQKECQLLINSYLKIGLYTFHLILKLVVNIVGLPRFRAKSFSWQNIIMKFLLKLSLDRNDRNSSDYTCSIRTARLYLRIFFWFLDRAVLSLVIIICFLAQHNIGDNMWKKLQNRHKERRRFQIALALEMMIYAIELDWKRAYNKNEKPRWIKQYSYIPYGCNICFSVSMERHQGCIITSQQL